jgi:type IV secretory pathway component VirB8
MFITQLERKIARSNPTGDFAERIYKRIEKQRRKNRIIDIVLFTVLMVILITCAVIGCVIFE